MCKQPRNESPQLVELEALVVCVLEVPAYAVELDGVLVEVVFEVEVDVHVPLVMSHVDFAEFVADAGLTEEEISYLLNPEQRLAVVDATEDELAWDVPMFVGVPEESDLMGLLLLLDELDINELDAIRDAFEEVGLVPPDALSVLEYLDELAFLGRPLVR